MHLKLDHSWGELLKSEMNSSYFKDLENFIEDSIKNNDCFPQEELIFNALNHCTIDNVKVVIIGQDPYHDNGQANGLSFSVNTGKKIPPSLKNIYSELSDDINFKIPDHGDLSYWAKQGVLLLNDTLTVAPHKAGSHQKKGWSVFTNKIIELVASKNENIVFMLWGGFAIKKGAKIDKEKHLVLESGHPSPLSANRGYWFGNKHFSKCNAYLKSIKKSEIDWSLEMAQNNLFLF